MPAKAPLTIHAAKPMLLALARQIRQRRLELGVSSVVAAHVAGMSRVTWHRLENAQPSVTLGSYLNAVQVLGLDIQLHAREGDRTNLASTTPEPNQPGQSCKFTALPERIQIQRYPQLREIAWHIKDGFELTQAEALGLYERNRRYLDRDKMTVDESGLVAALEDAAARGAYAV